MLHTILTACPLLEELQMLEVSVDHLRIVALDCPEPRTLRSFPAGPSSAFLLLSRSRFKAVSELTLPTKV
jgi:hypothetical protein